MLVSLSVKSVSAHIVFFFFFNDTATTEIYTLSLHDALPISRDTHGPARDGCNRVPRLLPAPHGLAATPEPGRAGGVVMERSQATIAAIFETMDYGPAPESEAPALEWITRHGGEVGHFIGGGPAPAPGRRA